MYFAALTWPSLRTSTASAGVIPVLLHQRCLTLHLYSRKRGADKIAWRRAPGKSPLSPTGSTLLFQSSTTTLWILAGPLLKHLRQALTQDRLAADLPDLGLGLVAPLSVEMGFAVCRSSIVELVSIETHRSPCAPLILKPPRASTWVHFAECEGEPG